MRKIDTAAYNKRLHSEILELDKMLKQIKPEHINLFDADLIQSAQNYVRVISDANWADNSNFNGIEMHKIKDLLSMLRSRKKTAHIGRDILTMRKEGDEYFRLNHIIACPELFDGRSSVIVPRVTYESESESVWSGKVDESFVLGHASKFVIYKQPSKVTIDFEIEVADVFTDIIYMTIFYIFWR